MLPDAQRHRSELIKIRPRMDSLYAGCGRTVLATDRDGFIRNAEHGLFFWETRVLSRYELLIDEAPPLPVALSNVLQDTWHGYYLAHLALNGEPAKVDLGSGQVQPETVHSLELKLARTVVNGFAETITLTNYSGREREFDLTLIIDADFADLFETSFRRVQKGCLEKSWQAEQSSRPTLTFSYHTERNFHEQDESGSARFHARVKVGFASETPLIFDDDKILCRIRLPPLASHVLSVKVIPTISGRIDDARFSESLDSARVGSPARQHERPPTRIVDPTRPRLQSVAIAALAQAREDLQMLRLPDLDTAEGWTVAAGSPIYTALFGRDVLTTSWQAALLGPELMAGSLTAVASHQGTRVDNWRDEEPGKMLHEAHTGPMSLLNFFPRSRYYGSSTTSILFPFLVSELWHWSGNRALVSRLIEPALKALEWADRYGDLDGDGFYEYRSRSRRGTRHQGWKDSDDAIVDENGTQLDAPIAMSEEQAFTYVSKLHFAEVLWWFNRRDEAKRLKHEAAELKKRFNDHFWLDDLAFVAMGLDSAKKPIRSIGSDAGHCLATGILDQALIGPVADRMMRPELFSGWGIRTLSSEHPAFNPYSYHRGSIWPVENGTFALGFVRYGLHQHAETLSRSLFEACSIFEAYRLPELFSGHPRDHQHPFPALYPRANFPQAWSSSSLFSVLQGLLGIYPYAPARLLFVDPYLPRWLPRVTLKDLRVGDARVSLTFKRRADGRSTFEINELEGKLRVVRQPNPWSLSASLGERARGLVETVGSYFA